MDLRISKRTNTLPTNSSHICHNTQSYSRVDADATVAVCVVIIVSVLYVCAPGEHDMDRVFKLPSTTFIGGSEKVLPLR